ncbi:MAG: hypothetical protein N4A46_12935 [Schleiferiaceae bacterium]|jgi:hypothetical protein|nr:hypothetical protein [Schleiferiaceae bacterium]
MLPLKTKKARQALLNEIVATIEFLDYLKYEALVPVQAIIKKEESKKEQLIAELRNTER